MIFDSFAEGVAATVLPCSWVLLSLPALPVIATGGRRAVVAGALFGATFGLMLRTGGFAAVPPGWGPVAGLAYGAAVLVAVRAPGAAPMGALCAGMLGAGLWQPCVGAELGAILGTGVERPVLAAAQMVPYAAGTLLAIPALGFATEMLPHVGRRRAGRAASILAAILVVVVALGLHEPAIGMLAEISAQVGDAAGFAGTVLSWTVAATT